MEDIIKRAKQYLSHSLETGKANSKNFWGTKLTPREKKLVQDYENEQSKTHEYQMVNGKKMFLPNSDEMIGMMGATGAVTPIAQAGKAIVSQAPRLLRNQSLMTKAKSILNKASPYLFGGGIGSMAGIEDKQEFNKDGLMEYKRNYNPVKGALGALVGGLVIGKGLSPKTEIPKLSNLKQAGKLTNELNPIANNIISGKYKVHADWRQALGKNPQLMSKTDSMIKKYGGYDDTIDFFNAVKQSNKLPTKSNYIPAKSGQSTEAMLEKATGWASGDRVKFDTALFNKDAKGIREMLYRVPSEYKQRFAKEIDKILKPNYTPLKGRVLGAKTINRDVVSDWDTAVDIIKSQDRVPMDDYMRASSDVENMIKQQVTPKELKKIKSLDKLIELAQQRIKDQYGR